MDLILATLTFVMGLVLVKIALVSKRYFAVGVALFGPIL